MSETGRKTSFPSCVKNTIGSSPSAFVDAIVASTENDRPPGSNFDASRLLSSTFGLVRPIIAPYWTNFKPNLVAGSAPATGGDSEARTHDDDRAGIGAMDFRRGAARSCAATRTCRRHLKERRPAPGHDWKPSSVATPVVGGAPRLGRFLHGRHRADTGPRRRPRAAGRSPPDAGVALRRGLRAGPHSQ